MPILQYKLPELPYSYDALEPVISREIVTLHHDKHHAAYVAGANSALEKLEKARNGEIELSVSAVMKELSFHVNGHLLHSIFWNNLRANNSDVGKEPSADLLALFAEQFGSFEAFKKEFGLAAKSVEGSGWAVLGADYNNNLVVYQVEKHNLLHLAGFDPILVLDVWEHAYYLDYKNDRAAYVEAFWNIVNWDDIETRVLGCDCCEGEGCEGCTSPDGCCGKC